jgi:AcrR family transcriptional regulator
LRSEIVAAATKLLVASGNPEHVTLRAVAREVGIAAPSIYLHFADRDELLMAVLIDAEGRFERALRSADPGPETHPHARCRAIGLAYAHFASRHKGAYQVLFSGLLPAPLIRVEVRRKDTMPGSFAVLYGACEAASAAAHGSVAPMTLALRLWSELHGFVTLKANMPGFPWPSAAAYIDATVMPHLPAMGTAFT